MLTHKRLVAHGVLLVLLVGAAGTGRVAAQEDGKLKFEIYQDRNQEFRWRLKHPNGSVLATGGQGYKAKADCQKGVENIKAGAAEGKYTFELYEDRAKEHRWRLKASNGQVVATSSEGYKAKADCEKAVEAIKNGAAKASVEDMKP